MKLQKIALAREMVLKDFFGLIRPITQMRYSSTSSR
jgi:hypothetical protein